MNAPLERFTGGARLMRFSAGAALLGLGLWGLGLWREPARALFAYLFSFVFWVSLALGALFLLAIFHASKARWPVVLRRMIETLALGLIPLAVLFVPIGLGLPHLYSWVNPEARFSGHALHLLHEKHGYLNVPGFLARAALYFAVWIAVGVLLHRLSARQDEHGELIATQRQRRLGAGALPFLAITLTFAAFDWLMSLHPNWFSTLFGVYYFAGAFLGAVSVLTLVTLLARGPNLYSALVTPAHWHNLGKFQLAFVSFWAYIAFSQYMLIWIANLPEEVVWFLERTRGGWRSYSVALVVVHFVIPFIVLLSRRVKLRARALALISTWLLVVHALDLYWLVLPTLHPDGPRPSWMDLAAFIGVGGVCVAFCTWRLRGQYTAPIRDPFLADSLHYVQP